MLGAAQVAAMAAMERAVLDLEGWPDNCQLAYAAWGGGSACLSPQSVLGVLHRNDAAHRAQCEQGFCHVSQACG